MADIPEPSPLPRRVSPRRKHPAKRSRMAVAAASAAAFVGITGTLAAHASGSSPTATTATTTDNGFAATPAAPSYQGPSNGGYSTQHSRSHAS